MPLLRPAAAVAALLAAGCGCDADLQARFDPASRRLAVGESFTPRVELRTCGGARRVSDGVTWAADDTSVVSVEPGTGRVTGRRAGTTSVLATGELHGAVGGVRVTVVAR